MNQMVISEELLEKLSREELVVLVKVLLAEIEQLKERVAELEAESPSGKPPATSRNSSQPPSHDQKTNLGEKKSQKRVGAKPGHKLATRPLVEKPDRVIEAKAERRPNCHADLHAVVPGRIIRHQIEELPMTRTIVIETQIHEVECPRCHTLQRGAPPEGLGLDWGSFFSSCLQRLETP